MAIDIPVPVGFAQSFTKGLGTGSDIMNRIMEQARLRQQMAQQQAYQEGELGIRKQEAQRAMKELLLNQEQQPLKLDLLRAKIQEAQRTGNEPLSDYGKAFADVQNIKNKFGKDSQEYIDAVKNLQSINQKKSGTGLSPYETESQKKQADLEFKEQQEALEAGDIVNRYVPNIMTVYETLKRNKNVTGPLKSLESKAGLGSKDYGTIMGNLADLQSSIAKEVSGGRGGKYAAQIAAGSKVDPDRSIQENLAKAEQFIQNHINQFKEAKKKYELYGKKYPYEMPEYYKKFEMRPIIIQSSDGNRHVIRADKLEEAKKRDTGLKVVD